MNLALETKQVFERWETGNEIFAMFLFIQWKMVFFLICRTPDFELLLLEKGASYVMVFTVTWQFYYCIENCCIYLLPFHIFQYWLVEFFLQGPGGGPDPHDRPFSRESCILHIFQQFPKSCFSFRKKYIKKSNLVYLLWPLKLVGRDGFWHSQQNTQTQIPHPVPNFGQVSLPGKQSNPGSRQYIYCFPDSRTVFWSNPESRKYPSRPCF